MRIDVLDLEFQGTPHVIAAFLLRGPRGAALVESGPSTTLDALLRSLRQHGVEPEEIRDVLLTHIHLDHAGAAGWWGRRGARIHVHPNGLPHLVDPTKLLASAARIYGDRMETLWGEVLPVPADRVVAVADRAELDIVGLPIRALDTPGHAGHHLTFHLGDIAFGGDAAGIRLPGETWIDLPAPPPEFDLEAWRHTLERLRGAGARTLYRTHFGPGGSVDEELEVFGSLLEAGAEWVREMIERGLERERMIEEFAGRMRARATAQGVDAATARAYELANPREMSVDGIARYWKRRGQVSVPTLRPDPKT
jgi:glyoxylase-like metal-dependent hydrolase (beta-lactamase superfamily II)